MAFRSLHPMGGHGDGGSNPNPLALGQLAKGGGRGLVTMSDDGMMMKQIMSTHAPDGRDFDVKPLLAIVEDILKRATPHMLENGPSNVIQAQTEIEDKAMQVNFIAMLEALSYVIDRIACEISYKALEGGDPHSITNSILNMLTTYAWEGKLVLAMAAFALNYGEFWLLAQIYSTNQLAKSMALLRQLPTIMERPGAPLKSRFDALNKLIRAMIDVTRCVVAFKELPPTYISHEVAALSTAHSHIPTAVYWTVRAVVVCATHIQGLTALGIESAISTTEAWELSTLAHKLSNIHDHLNAQLNACQNHVEEKRNHEAYNNFKDVLGMTHADNMKVLRSMIYPKDDIQPLFHGSTKRRVGIDELRRKNVLVLISSLDITQEELSVLEQIYDTRINVGRMESQYEIVWIPVVDRSSVWREAQQKQFEIVQSTMPWYSVHTPHIVDKAVSRYIKDEWHYRHKPILVVVDPQGKIVSPNAIHMLWIWGSHAFPFTSAREEALWREETWRLELLIDGIDQTILNWVKEDKYVFLYGGDDVEWARKFTNTAKAVAQAARIPVEMAYVGKSTKKEQVRRLIATIMVEKLSYCWQDLTMIWFFWTRLESMLFSKIQLGQADDHRDVMMQEIKRLLSFDKEGSWAILCKGSVPFVNGHGNTVLTTLLEYDTWKEEVAVKGFQGSFRDHHSKVHGVAYPCCRFEFPISTGRLPEYMTCPECHHKMERFATFKCCHEEGPIPLPNSTFSP